MALRITKIKPLFTAVVTTMNKYEEDAKMGSLIDATKAKGTLKEYQKVVAIGPSVREIQVGDMVMINPQRFATVNHKHKPNSLANDIQHDTTELTYSFDVVNIDGLECLYLQDRDIMFAFEGEELPDEDSVIKTPELII